MKQPSEFLKSSIGYCLGMSKLKFKPAYNPCTEPSIIAIVTIFNRISATRPSIHLTFNKKQTAGGPWPHKPCPTSVPALGANLWWIG